MPATTSTPMGRDGQSLFLSPPSQPPNSTLFPYTTLFRSLIGTAVVGATTMIFSIIVLLTHGLTQNLEDDRSEEHTSELQSLRHLVCRLLLEKKNISTTSGHARYIWTRSWRSSGCA